jgi:uncharacterized protein HemX
MDYNQNNQEQEIIPNNAPNQDQASVGQATTTRRTITAVLVLVAALLLGYVLYYFVLNDSGVTPDGNTGTAENTQTTTEERIAILESMQVAEGEVSAQEVERRLAALDAMNTDSVESSTAAESERKQALNALNKN